MTIAWSITECIRYSYYALNLVNLGPSWLVWCRYVHMGFGIWDLKAPMNRRTANSTNFFLYIYACYSYTFFFILYPVGAGSEAMEIYQAIPFAHNIHPAYSYFLWAMIAIYPPGNTLIARAIHISYPCLLAGVNTNTCPSFTGKQASSSCTRT
jgi:very-long-chain (3R)-3-hydroxyacyl-CoA dehydratase